MKHRVLVVVLAAASAAYGADREFDHLVKSVESHFGVKRTHIPLMGVANFFVKVVRPAGVKGFKLAVFEDLRSSLDDADQWQLDRFIDKACTGRMHRMMVTRSRSAGEATYILTGEIGKYTKMLIATFERDEATVVQAEVDMATLIKTIGSREEVRKLTHGGERRQRTEW